jgi:phage protein D
VIDVRTQLSPAPGASVMEVVAMDATVLMSLEEKVRAWPDQADSAIASTIFGEYGLTATVRDSQPVRRQAEHTTIQREHDMAFLRRLADRNGYECFVTVGDSGVEGHFHPPSLDEPEQGVLSVNLGPATNVDNFQARHDMMAATTADVRGLEIAGREEQPAQATGNEEPVLGADPALPGDRPRKVLLAGTGLSEGGELQTLAQAVTERSSFAVSAEGELNGAAYGDVLRAKLPVLVRGAGQAFSGRYYVERVTHQFTGEGWSQRFKLRRNAAGVASRDDFRDSDALPAVGAVSA